MKHSSLASVLLLIVCAALPAQEPTLDFSRDIRPILSDTCYQCHGPDANERQAGLRLDRRESAFAPLDSGAQAVVESDAAKSELIARITTDDESLRMPPAEDAPREREHPPGVALPQLPGGCLVTRVGPSQQGAIVGAHACLYRLPAGAVPAPGSAVFAGR